MASDRLDSLKGLRRLTPPPSLETAIRERMAGPKRTPGWVGLGVAAAAVLAAALAAFPPGAPVPTPSAQNAAAPKAPSGPILRAALSQGGSSTGLRIRVLAGAVPSASAPKIGPTPSQAASSTSSTAMVPRATVMRPAAPAKTKTMTVRLWLKPGAQVTSAVLTSKKGIESGVIQPVPGGAEVTFASQPKPWSVVVSAGGHAYTLASP